MGQDVYWSHNEQFIFQIIKSIFATIPLFESTIKAQITTKTQEVGDIDCVCFLTEVNLSSVSLSLQAQVRLASVYSLEPVRDRNKSVQYLKMAAESGVSALLDASRVLFTALLLSFSPPLPV